MNVKRTYVTLILSTLAFIGYAQDAKIGLIQSFRPGDSKALFIDADAGEIVGFAVFEETIWALRLSEDNKNFYAMSRNTLYKGSVASGEIIDKYQFMEVLEQGPNELTDPNLNIGPLGVTSDGKALFSYNAKLFELTKRQSEVISSMASAPVSELSKLSKESAEIAQQMQPLYTLLPTFLADINTKSKSPYIDFDHRGEKFAGITMDGDVQTFDLKTNKLYLRDLNTKEISKEFDASAIYLAKPALKSMMPGVQSMISENLMFCTYFNPQVALQGVSLIYDVENSDVILSYQFTNTFEMIYPLYYTDCTEYKFAKNSCEMGPMPAAPDFGQPAGTSKKKVAEWQEEMKKKQAAHQKALKEWQDQATNPENCDMEIYSDASLSNEIFNIENAAGGVVYKDKYLLIQRNFEVAMYDIDTKELMWAVDTDF